MNVSETTPINKKELVLISLTIINIAVVELFFASYLAAYGIISALASITIFYLIISIAKLGHFTVEFVETTCLLLTYVLLVSSLPWFFIRQDMLLPAVYLVLIVLCLWYIWNSNLKLKYIGIKPAALKYIALCSVIGIITGTVEYQILRPAPAYPSFSISYFLQQLFYMVAFVGLGEELLFRGILVTNIKRLFNNYYVTSLLSSTIFAIMHFTWRSVPELIFVFLTGNLLVFFFERTKSILPSIMLHAINNVVLVAVLPFL
jgi:hypothetical protein